MLHGRVKFNITSTPKLLHKKIYTYKKSSTSSPSPLTIQGWPLEFSTSTELLTHTYIYLYYSYCLCLFTPCLGHYNLSNMPWPLQSILLLEPLLYYPLYINLFFCSLVTSLIHLNIPIFIIHILCYIFLSTYQYTINTSLQGNKNRTYKGQFKSGANSRKNEKLAPNRWEMGRRRRRRRKRQHRYLL